MTPTGTSSAPKRTLQIARFARWAAWIGVVAVFAIVIGAFARFYQAGHGFTYVLDIGETLGLERLPEVERANPYIHESVPGYDGAFYAQLSLRPAVNDPELVKVIDSVPYRGRRMLGPWIAWLVGAGKPSLVLEAYACLNLVSWLALAVLLWRWFPLGSPHDFLRWSGVLLSAGVLGSLRHALSDGPALLAIAASVALLESKRPWISALVGALAGMTRETAIAVAAIFSPVDLRDRAQWVRSATRGVVVALPILLWMAYLRVTWSDLFVSGGGLNNFAWPLKGFIERWVYLVGAIGRNGWNDPYASSLLLHLGFTVQLLWIALRPRWTEAWWRIGATHAALLLLLDVEVWEGFPGAAPRVLLPLCLAFNVLAPRTRAGLALVVLGNLGVAAGFMELSPPPAPTAIVTGSSRWITSASDGGSVRVTFSEAFRSPESYGGYAWRWLSSGGRIQIDNPHAVPIRASLRLGLRAPSKREVTLELAGKRHWSGSVDKVLLPVDLGVIELPPGGVVLEVVTGPPDPPNGDEPPLAVAVYDLVVDVIGPVDGRQ